jgi:hypothetical protein
MFKVAQIIGKSTLTKVLPASKLAAKTTISTLAPVSKFVATNTLQAAFKLPFALAKISSSMIPMLMSAALGGVYLIIKLMK